MVLGMSISPQLGEERRVNVPAGAISYRERGAGTPIVFIHGVAVNGDLWRRVVPGLADSPAALGSTMVRALGR